MLCSHFDKHVTKINKLRMWKLTCFQIYAVIWLVFLSLTSAQEYLPPKIGGAGGSAAKQPLEPTLPANYEFTYDVQDNAVNLDFGHNEKRKEDLATGSYHVLLPDGRTQLVEYEAGPNGYMPQIMYMGTATYPSASSDKFDGYHYNAASNRASVRQAAPRGPARPPAPPAAPAPPTSTDTLQ